MKKGQLAKQLRQRQYDAGFVKRSLIDALSDDQIINSYITCSCCENKTVNERQLKSAIHDAQDAVDFIQICSGFRKTPTDK